MDILPEWEPGAFGQSTFKLHSINVIQKTYQSNCQLSHFSQRYTTLASHIYNTWLSLFAFLYGPGTLKRSLMFCFWLFSLNVSKCPYVKQTYPMNSNGDIQHITCSKSNAPNSGWLTYMYNMKLQDGNINSP